MQINIVNHDQGCCWAFSAVGAMEGINQIKNGKLISLSEQELVDCDVHGNDQGCEGGIMQAAFTFIQNNGGLNTEAGYPYKEADGKCNARNAATSAAAIRGYEDVPANDEEALQKAVSQQPVSVALDANSPDFRHYSGGVYAGGCGLNLDHAMTAVGYGTTDDGTKYWVMKNSWGRNWGEDGYIRMARDVDAEEGMCGIAMESSYPVL